MGGAASVVSALQPLVRPLVSHAVAAFVFEISKLFAAHNPEQENQTITAVQDRLNQSGRITYLGEQEDNAEPTAPSLDIEKVGMINAYLQTSMAGSHKLSPTLWPTEKEFNDAKERFEYRSGNLHFAITGIAGSGKSSLVNSFRGLLACDDGAAETGVNETTITAGRYPYPDKSSPLSSIVWYDIPGAGTQSTPGGSEYFNAQGLFIFDFIIVATGDRFTEQDLDILANCKMYNIPSFVVRSKADIHIKNMKRKFRGCSYDDARRRYIDETRMVFKRELERAPKELNLDCDKEIFLVSDEVLHGYIMSLMDGEDPENTEALIDEQSLVTKVLLAAQMRRYPSKYGMGWALLKISKLGGK